MIVFDADKKEIVIRDNVVRATKVGTGIKIKGAAAEGWRVIIQGNELVAYPTEG